MCKSGSNLYMHYIAMYETGTSNNYDVRFSLISTEEILDSIAKIANYMYNNLKVDTYIPCTGRVFVNGENCITLGICCRSSTQLLFHVIKTSNHSTYTKYIEAGINHTIISDTVSMIIRS